MPSFQPIAFSYGVTYGMMSSLLSDLILLGTKPGMTSQILHPSRTILSSLCGFLFFVMFVPKRNWEFIQEVYRTPGLQWKLSLDNYLQMSIFLSLSNYALTEILIFLKYGLQPFVFERLLLAIPAHASVIGIVEGFGAHNWLRNWFYWQHIVHDPSE